MWPISHFYGSLKFHCRSKSTKRTTIVWATSFFYHGFQKCFLLYRLKAVKNSFTMKLTLTKPVFYWQCIILLNFLSLIFTCQLINSLVFYLNFEIFYEINNQKHFLVPLVILNTLIFKMSFRLFTT